MTATPTLAGPRGLVRRALTSGLVDRLTAPHGVDRYLELLDPRWTVRDIRAEVVAVRHQTPGTVTLTLRPNKAWAGFRAGQHVEVGVEVDGVVHQRCFSLAGSPRRSDGTIELTVKATRSGIVARHLVDHAAPGTVVRLSPAQGDFLVPDRPDARRHLVFVSGGSGITPVLSMLRQLADDGHPGPVTFVHYAPTLAEVCYLDELRALVDRLPAGRLLLGLTAAPDDGDLTGHWGDDHLAAVTDQLDDVDLYLCGPASLADAVADHLSRLGLDDRLHRERFGVTVRVDDPDATGGHVTFSAAGVASPAAGTLLDTAEAAGLRPAFGCRRGICGTCTRTKTAGVVRDVVTGRHSGDQSEPVRLCVSVPSGDVVVDL